MKILVVSTNAIGPLAVVNRLTKEGHDVKWFSFEDSIIGRGIVDKPDSWRSEIGASDLIVCIGRDLMPILTAAQSLGKPVLGISEISHKTFKEINTDLSLPVLNEVKVTDEDLVETLQQWHKDGFFVSQQENDWPQHTWECRTEEDFTYAVQQRIDGHKYILQQRQVGECFSVVGWWNGRKWLKPFHLHWKSDLREPYSSGMLSVIDKQETLEMLILPLKDLLKKSSYKGPVFVDCIMTKEQIYVMNIRFELRPDYFSLLAEGAFQGMADLLFEVAVGTATGIRYHPGYVVGDVLYGTNLLGAPLNGLNEHNEKHIAFVGVRGDDKYTYVGIQKGPIMMITARGETLREAGRRVIRTTNNLSLINLDLSNRQRVDLPAEQSLGNILNWGHI